MKPFAIEARANTRTESPKIRNRQQRKKFNDTPTRPRLSVFCCDKQLYVTLVDDQNKKNIFMAAHCKKQFERKPVAQLKQLHALAKNLSRLVLILTSTKCLMMD